MNEKLLLMILIGGILSAQVGINTSAPNKSSILDVTSSTKGVLVPRMTTVQRDAIVSPASGLQIYDTDRNCLSVNQGDSTTPDWYCQNEKSKLGKNIPSTISAIKTLDIRDTEATSGALNWQTWTDVPELTATFTLTESKNIKFDWSLFSGVGRNEGNRLTEDSFAQMFTCISITGGSYTGNIAKSTNFVNMIHNPGGQAFWALMNNNMYSYVEKNMLPGTYTVKIRIYASNFTGNLNYVIIGNRIDYWVGGSNMIANEKLNGASNKLTISFL